MEYISNKLCDPIAGKSTNQGSQVNASGELSCETHEASLSRQQHALNDPSGSLATNYLDISSLNEWSNNFMQTPLRLDDSLASIGLSDFLGGSVETGWTIS